MSPRSVVVSPYYVLSGKWKGCDSFELDDARLARVSDSLLEP